MDTLDIKQLEAKFFITGLEPEDTVFKIRADQLLEADQMEHFISLYASMIKALDYPAAASYFTSWFSRVALAMQYTLSAYSAVFDFSLPNLTICLVKREDYYILFKMDQLNLNTAAVDLQQRARWRQQAITQFYSETVRPLFEQLSAISNLKKEQIWGQLPTYFNYFMDSYVDEMSTYTAKQRMIDDYRFLKQGLDPEVFGCKRNPFDVKIRWVEDWEDPEQRVRLKNACCLYYRLEDGCYCYTCPKLTKEERQAKKLAYLAEMKLENDDG